MSAAMSALEAVLHALRELGNGAHSDQTIANKAGVHRKTVLRLQPAICAVGIEVTRRNGYPSIYNLDPYLRVLQSPIPGTSPVTSPGTNLGHLSQVPTQTSTSIPYLPLNNQQTDKPTGRRVRVRQLPRTPVPDNWWPDKRGQVYANERNVPRSEVAKFVNYHQRNGTLSASWAASWISWCANYVRFKEEAARKATEKTVSAVRPMWGGGYHA